MTVNISPETMKTTRRWYIFKEENDYWIMCLVELLFRKEREVKISDEGKLKDIVTNGPTLNYWLKDVKLFVEKENEKKSWASENKKEQTPEMWSYKTEYFLFLSFTNHM